MADRRIPVGAGFGLAGLGLGILLWVLEMAELTPPGWALATIGSLAVLLVLLGILMMGTAMLPRKKLNLDRNLPMSERDKEQPTIHVESYGQQGGITAGIVNIQAESKPNIDLSEMKHEEVANGHRYEAILTVQTQYAVPQIRLTANAPSIQALNVTPMRSGMHMFGHTGKREGYHFTTIQNAAGKYRVQVTTAGSETVRIDLE